jgi:prepilin-type N-terminal cleavage/methylation domain-containing protein
MNKSFTLIEILVVIVVIGVLSAFILVGMSSITSSANIAKTKAFLNSMDNSLLLARVSQWKFDELTTAINGTTTIDSWSSNTGTLSTGDALEKLSTNCPSGKCLSFDGTNDYVDTFNPNFGSSNYTISIWFKNLDTDLTFTRDLFSQRENPDGTADVVAIYHSTNHYLNYRVLNNAVGTQSVFSSVPASHGDWHYVAITRNNSNMLMYVDGVNVTSSPSLTGDVPPFGVNFGIGKSSGYYGASWEGLVDDVRIYNQGIPTSEIQQNYYLGSNRLFKNNGISLKEFNQRIVELKNNIANK